MKAYQMKIAIKNSHPPIWRRFIVPAGLSFSQLSIVLNGVMGWCGYHLFKFEFYHLRLNIKEKYEDFIGLGEEEQLEASETIIDPFMEQEDWFSYIYDFGDYWEHRVTIEKVIEDYGSSYPVVLKYKGETPFEDCGGIYRYYDLQEILKDPSHPEHGNMKAWTEGHFTRDYDLNEVNESLKRMALEKKKSKPMLQNEIYEEIMEKGGGFKTIQGIKESEVDRKNGTLMSERLSEMEDMLKDYTAKYMELKEALDSNIMGATLRDILEEYRKDDLFEICKLHGLSGFRKLSKKDLIDFVYQNLLSKEVMCRCLMYMNDMEMELMDKENTGVDECEEVLGLIECGYAGATYLGEVYVPEDVKAAYNKNCDEEWKKERRRVQGILCHINACVELYGICPLERVISVYKENTGNIISETELREFCYQIPGFLKIFEIVGSELVQETLLEEDRIQQLKKSQGIKPYYNPTKEEIQTLGNYFYVPFDRYMDALADFFVEFMEEEEEDARELCRNIQRIIRCGGQMQDVIDYLQREIVIMDGEDFYQFAEIFMRLWNHTRMHINRGYMPAEMDSPKSKKRVQGAAAKLGFRAVDDMPGDKADIIDFQEERRKKVYPNDPCPCGSGKKYKHCCGKKK
ncbi:IS1096 element passenger TnpR family protein [Blautia sp.]|uniref:IS1096 element passenger TnpR family protein n=1 Tax=Blautia sp. TaxID=1955243 RepID=UPI002590CDF2|nr:SEC-C metal-binding domain-containing protein [Blautia sp.]